MDYRDRIKQEFIRRKEKNPSYSIRAFARFLKISHPTLIEILSKERNLSKASLRQVVSVLEWSSDQFRSAERQIREETRESNGPSEGARKRLGPKHYPLLAKWYYLPTLYLAEIEENRATPAWVRSKLRISTAEAKQAIDLLEKLDLIRVEGGKMIPNQKGVCFFETPPSRELLQNALDIHSISRHWLGKPDEKRQIRYVGTLALDQKGFDRLAKRMNQLKIRTDKEARLRQRDSVFMMMLHVFPAEDPSEA